MTLQIKSKYHLFILCFLLLSNCQQAEDLPANSPNFLIILTDDLDYSELGCYGGEIPTPNIDQLAKEGVLFTNFHTTQDDAKTRSMLLTGTSQAQIPSTHQLLPQAMTIAQLLKEVGYRTMMSGKWNLGKEKMDMPIEKGFDQSFVLLQEMANHLGNTRYLPAIYRENSNIKEISEDFYSTQYYARKLLSFLSKGKKKLQQKPFLALLSFTAPHYPLQAPKRVMQNFKGQYDEGYAAVYEERLANQLALGIHSGIDVTIPNWEDLTTDRQAREARKMEIYAAMVHDMDKQIGSVVDFLKVAKKHDNTVIIFLSDGGITKPKTNTTNRLVENELANLGNANSMVSLGENWTNIKLGNKGSKVAAPFDNSVKAPLIISSPLLQNITGSRNDELKTVLDIMPTILKLVGLPHPSENYFTDILTIEGKSLLEN